jgi:hypothetical protein
MTDNRDDLLNEARGLSIASASLCFGLVTLLYKKGLIQKADMDDFYEGVLGTLEKDLSPTDPAVKVARGLVDGMAQVAANLGNLSPKADRP